METTQGISLYSLLHLNLAKTTCFSYYLLHFFLQQIRIWSLMTSIYQTALLQNLPLHLHSAGRVAQWLKTLSKAKVPTLKKWFCSRKNVVFLCLIFVPSPTTHTLVIFFGRIKIRERNITNFLPKDRITFIRNHSFIISWISYTIHTNIRLRENETI
jgi:hypothetical protein